MKGKNSHVFLSKKVGGALIRVGALNRDYTVLVLSEVPSCPNKFGQLIDASFRLIFST